MAYVRGGFIPSFIHMDEPLKKLKESGIGCTIGKSYFGALSYADDLALICHSIVGLQSMINICTEFGKQYDIAFNPKKTVTICFSKTPKPVDFTVVMHRRNIPCSSSVKYLGCYLMYNLKEEKEIEAKQNDFIAKVNSLIYRFNFT